MQNMIKFVFPSFLGLYQNIYKTILIQFVLMLEAYSESCEIFAKNKYRMKAVDYFCKKLHLDVSQSSENGCSGRSSGYF